LCVHFAQKQKLENKMQRGLRYLGFILLSAALSAPMASAKSVLATQDHDDHDRDRDHHRVYDSDHHDYHDWDDREDAAYRGWLENRHAAYVDYAHLKHRDQQAYWRWRHEHEEHDRH
jgi:hypothetical protein